MLSSCSREHGTQTLTVTSPTESNEIALLKGQIEIMKTNVLLASNRINQLNEQIQSLKQSPEVKRAAIAADQQLAKIKVSEETRKCAILLFEKAAKIDAMASQGLTHSALRDQLGEVQASLSTMILLGWPPEWNLLQQEITSAIEAWALANKTWDAKTQYATEPRASRDELLDKDFEFVRESVAAYLHGALDADERSLERSFNSAIQSYSSRALITYRYDAAVQFFMGVGSLHFRKAQQGLNKALREPASSSLHNTEQNAQ